jgi:hypothetical protein
MNFVDGFAVLGETSPFTLTDTKKGEGKAQACENACLQQ